MIKVGLICEDISDKTIFSSVNFKEYLFSLNIDIIDDIINADGCGNLLPHNIEGYINRLENKGAEKIIIIRDKDNFPCFTAVKQVINARPKDIVVVPVVELESWFLANTPAMRNLLGIADFIFEHPENERNPFDKINELLVFHTKTKRGIGKKKSSKLKLARKLIEIGFKLEESAKHPNCPSAKYFINKLEELVK